MGFSGLDQESSGIEPDFTSALLAMKSAGFLGRGRVILQVSKVTDVFLLILPTLLYPEIPLLRPVAPFEAMQDSACLKPHPALQIRLVLCQVFLQGASWI